MQVTDSRFFQRCQNQDKYFVNGGSGLLPDLESLDFYSPLDNYIQDKISSEENSFIDDEMAIYLQQ